MRKIVEEDWGTFNALVLYRASHAEAEHLPANHALVAAAVAAGTPGVTPLAGGGGIGVGRRDPNPAAATTSQRAGVSGLPAAGKAQPPKQKRWWHRDTTKAAKGPNVPRPPRLRKNHRAADEPAASTGRERKTGKHPREAEPPDSATDLAGVYKRIRWLWSRENTLVAQWHRFASANPSGPKAWPLIGLGAFALDLMWLVIKLVETIYWVSIVLLMSIFFLPFLLLSLVISTAWGIAILIILAFVIIIYSTEKIDRPVTEGAAQATSNSNQPRPR